MYDLIFTAEAETRSKFIGTNPFSLKPVRAADVENTSPTHQLFILPQNLPFHLNARY